MFQYFLTDAAIVPSEAIVKKAKTTTAGPHTYERNQQTDRSEAISSDLLALAQRGVCVADRRPKSRRSPTPVALD